MGPELLVAGLLLASGLLVALERRLSRRVGRLAAQLERTAALKADLRWWQASLQNLAEWQEVTESSIDGGTRAVHALHKGIAAVPFEILEAIPATRDTTRIVRDVHDFAADNVYAAVSAVNRLLGTHGRRLIEGGSPARELPPAQMPTAEPGRSREGDPGRNGR